MSEAFKARHLHLLCIVRLVQRDVQSGYLSGFRQIRASGPDFAQTENHQSSGAVVLPNDPVDDHYGGLSDLQVIEKLGTVRTKTCVL